MGLYGGWAAAMRGGEGSLRIAQDLRHLQRQQHTVLLVIGIHTVSTKRRQPYVHSTTSAGAMA